MISVLNIKKDKKVSIQEMSLLATKIINHFYLNEYNTLDDILKTFDFQSANKTIIIGMTRYTYSGRHKLPEWNNFLSKAKTELDSRKIKHSLNSIALK